MKWRHLLPAIFLAVVFCYSPKSSAQVSSPEKLSHEQRSIIRTVQSVDGYIDQSLHEEFWSSVPAELRRSPDLRRELERLLLDVSDHRISFMKASWLSAKASLDAGRVVRTKEYLASRDALLDASENAAFKQKVTESIASAERLIAAAAQRSPIEVDGGKLYITSDLVTQVLSGVAASEYRVGLLLKPNWSQTVEEFRYPEANVAILSTSPFSVERKSITAENGKTVELILLGQRYGPQSFLNASFVETGGAYANPTKSLASNVRAAIEGAGAASSNPVITPWRGMNSATAFGNAETSEGTVFVSVRAVEVPEFRGIIQFMAVTDMSGAEALNLRGILEDSTVLLTN